MSANGDGARRARKEQTRRALLEAARRCFAEKGWDAVVADIVQEAGVAHGTFYVHFESREAIADALLAEWNAALATRLARVVARDSDVSSKVRSAARIFLAHLDEDRAFVAWYAERAASGLRVEALRDGINPPVFAVLASAIPGERGALAAHGLLALWLRVGLQYALAGTTSRRVAEDVLVRMTTGAIAALRPEPKPQRTIRRSNHA